MYGIPIGPVGRDLVKKHVTIAPSDCTVLWKAGDMDEVVENYLNFLKAAAEMQSRVSKPTLLKVLKKCLS